MPFQIPRLSDPLPACPHCGGTDGFCVAAEHTMPYDEIFRQDGSYVAMEERNGGRGRRKSRDVVRCDFCRKVRVDVVYTRYGIKAKYASPDFAPNWDLIPANFQWRVVDAEGNVGWSPDEPFTFTHEGESQWSSYQGVWFLVQYEGCEGMVRDRIVLPEGADWQQEKRQRPQKEEA